MKNRPHQKAGLLDAFPHPVKLADTHVREEHVKWLQQNIPNGYKSRWTYAGPHQINFAQEDDKLLFVLRWA